MRLFPVCSLVLAATVACFSREPTPDTSKRSEPPIVRERQPGPDDSATIRMASRAFTGFLEGSKEGYKGRLVQWDTLFGCDPSSEPAFPITMLATYGVLPFALRGDTVVAQAEVVSVAEQEQDQRRQGRYVANQRVRYDTLEWDVVHDTASGRWLVCNGVRFGFVGTDSQTVWRSLRGSFQSARSLAAMMQKEKARDKTQMVEKVPK